MRNFLLVISIVIFTISGFLIKDRDLKDKKNKEVVMEKENREKRLPPGQREVKEIIELTKGDIPKIDKSKWRLKVYGEVENPMEFDWKKFSDLKQDTSVSDFHCVTGWSVLGVKWEGVKFKALVEKVKVKPEAKFVIFESYDDYTTNIPLEDALRDNVILAVKLYNQELTLEHGGPVRLVVPHLYAWKSAKWVKGIKFSKQDEPGFWETRGYHNYGDVWKEQRFQEK
jgi:DMSO/TMAO reductase YedYZ molybdopterin-dependent catalytic subunit